MKRNLARALGVAVLASTLLVSGLGGTALAGTSTPSGVVNVNTATAGELMALPGIGEARARAILEMREARGGFESIEELEDVKGIGPRALDRLRPNLTLEGRTTLASD